MIGDQTLADEFEDFFEDETGIKDQIKEDTRSSSEILAVDDECEAGDGASAELLSIPTGCV